MLRVDQVVKCNAEFDLLETDFASSTNAVDAAILVDQKDMTKSSPISSLIDLCQVT